MDSNDITKQQKTRELFLLRLKSFEVSVKFLDTFKLSQSFLFLLENTIFLIDFLIGKFFGYAPLVFKDVKLIHCKNQFEFFNPVFHIHKPVIGSLCFREGKILLNNQFKIVEFGFGKIVFTRIDIGLGDSPRLTRRCKSHHGERMVCTIIPQFRSRFAADSPKEFILNLFEKFFGYFCILIVVITGSVYVFNLLIKYFLLNSDSPDALNKLTKVVHGRPAFESFIVKGESFDYILSEPLGRPLAELSALSGFDSVSHRDNDIKTVIFHRLVRICNLQKMQIAFLRKLSIMKYVADMSGYNTYIPLKQFAHLALCKPDGLIGKEDIYLYNAVLGLVYYNFVIHNHIKTSATVSCRDKVTLRDITSVAELNIFRESVTNHLIQS